MVAQIFTNVLVFSVGLDDGDLSVFLIAAAFLLGALLINCSIDEKPVVYREMLEYEELEMNDVDPNSASNTRGTGTYNSNKVSYN